MVKRSVQVVPDIDNVENKEMKYVNTTLPIDNMPVTFEIPANTSDYPLKGFATTIPSHKYYYRYISDIDYRVDTSGIYNITTDQVVSYVDGTGSHTITLGPGFYNVQALSTTLSDVINPIALFGANSFKAVEKAGVLSVDLTNAPMLAAILGWPSTVGAGFVPTSTVDVTQFKDLMFVYLSFCRQSTENAFANVAAIPIAPATVGNLISGTIHQKTPILKGLDVISDPVIRIRDAQNKPYLINTPVTINVKMLFSIKNHNLGY